jgi:hypothetical protein
VLLHLATARFEKHRVVEKDGCDCGQSQGENERCVKLHGFCPCLLFLENFYRFQTEYASGEEGEVKVYPEVCLAAERLSEGSQT